MTPVNFRERELSKNTSNLKKDQSAKRNQRMNEGSVLRGRGPSMEKLPEDP
jgi:hypothetical protein